MTDHTDTMTLTPDKIRELRKLRQAGTQDVWRYDELSPITYWDDACTQIKTVRLHNNSVVFIECETTHGEGSPEANAALITAAVNNLEALCDEVERLREGVADERDRCVSIINAARVGDIDDDLRSIRSRIESGKALKGATHEG